MEMVHFDCDYMAGAHPDLLTAISDHNFEQTCGYGSDDYCRQAGNMIIEACGLSSDRAAVHFMVGGTQTNSTVLSSLLSPTEGVIAADTGHINVHEAGAIELSGHKVISLPGRDGKLDADEVRRFIESLRADDSMKHMVSPGAVYISFPTELGTIYTRDELSSLHEVCHEYGLPLFLDGARLGYGLAASEDVTLKDIAALADVFYIGGTKMGALFGEAVVCPDRNILPRFFTLMKARGAVLAKGRFLGLQFLEFFRDGLYLRIGRRAVDLAMRLREVFRSRGYDACIDSPTNQQFLILPNALIKELMEKVTFELSGPRGESESMVRFVTSWETTESDIEALAEALDGLIPYFSLAGRE